MQILPNNDQNPRALCHGVAPDYLATCTYFCPAVHLGRGGCVQISCNNIVPVYAAAIFCQRAFIFPAGHGMLWTVDLWYGDESPNLNGPKRSVAIHNGLKISVNLVIGAFEHTLKRRLSPLLGF